MSTAKISVIVPVFNTRPYLEACVNSLLSQTHPKIQILLVDDGSTDGSSQLCDDLSKRDSRVEVVHQANGGLSDARNAGLSQASGNFVCFIDSDDWVESRMLESMLKPMADENVDVVMAGMIIDQEDAQGRLISTKHRVPSPQVLTRGALTDKSIDDQFINMLGYAWNKLYRADFLRSNHLVFTKSLKLIEDIDFNTRVFLLARRVAVLNSAFVHYLQRPAPTLGSVLLPDFISLRHRAIEDTKRVLLHWGISQTLADNVAAKMGISALRATTARILELEDKSTLHQRRLLLHARHNGSTLKNSFTLLHLKLWQRLYLWGFFYCPSWLWIKAWKFYRSTLPRLSSSRKAILRFKIKLHSFRTSSSATLVNSASTKPHAFIFLAADYGNLGDLAITEAQKNFLEAELSDHEVIEVPISQTLSGIKTLKKRIRPHDLITLIGGGNTGDLYDDIQYLRELVIAAFPSNRIISFPQTIEFSDTSYGQWALKRAKRVFSSHKQLTLLARDSKSAQLASELFYSTPVFAAPDIVLSLSLISKQSRVRSGCLVALRDDLERHPSTPGRDSIQEQLSSFGPVRMVDTHVGDIRLNPHERHDALIRVWDSFAESEVVVTDRLHGMIFSVITGTPCVVINSQTGKVFQFLHDWLMANGDSRSIANMGSYPILDWSPENGLDIRECVESLRDKAYCYNPEAATNLIRSGFTAGFEI